jgi:hypothetical protein
MATKYIVNNAQQQTISGNVSISGNLNFTGRTNEIGTYKALLSQTGSITGTNIDDFGSQLIIGETYTITNYVNGDDFYNVADIQSGGTLIFDYVGTAPGVGYGAFNGVTGTTSGSGSGATFDVYWCGATYNVVSVVSSGVDYVIGDTITILGTDVDGSTPANNITITITDLTPTETGCVFIATADVPFYWGEGSELVSDGDIVSHVLENTLGFDIDWVWYDTGYYVGYRSEIPFTYYNEFPRNNIYTNAQSVYPFDFYPCPFSPLLTIGSNYDYYPNDSIFLTVTDVCGGPGPAYVDNFLYFTPVEISIKKEYLDIYGGIDASFPFNYVSLALFCNGNYIGPIFTDDTNYVNNMSELITLLNNDTQSKVYDISFSEGGPGGIIMKMPKDIKNLFCAGELEFLVYSDNEG